MFILVYLRGVYLYRKLKKLSLVICFMLKSPTATVTSVQFGVLSPDEIREMSVALIEHPEPLENKTVKIGGLLDPRLGPIDKNTLCSTCNQTMAVCPGHFGHIELAKPVFSHWFFIQGKKNLGDYML